MYSPQIVSRHLEKIEFSSRLKLTRRSPAEVRELREPIEKLHRAEGGLYRPLTSQERTFVRNERLLSKFDYRHFRRNYMVFHRDGAVGGGVGTADFWASQDILLERLGQVEETAFQALREGYPTDGIRVVVHKSRQLGMTQEARGLTMHRLTQWTGHRAMAASIDDDKILELYDRDHLILDNLPWYLRPSMDRIPKPDGRPPDFYDVKAQHMHFTRLTSRILYQQSNQMTGLGQGVQFELSHLTECASWKYPNIIELDFFPTLPQSPWTLCILESTAQGRGNWWHEFTEEVRRGHRRGWIYVFIPYYIEPKKYLAHPPQDWNPSPLSLLHAKRVEETSAEFCRGETHHLTKEQLYWWETEREGALRGGSLNIFLTNYAATPEESFQHSSQGAFPYHVLERIRLGTRPGIPYELQIGGTH